MSVYASVALGHGIAFEFLSPSGVGSRTDGGEAVVRWSDGPDPLDVATLSFFARRPALTPFELVTTVTTGALALHGPEIAVSDPVNELRWDARAAEPGCYQPLVLVSDQVEGTSWQGAPGQLVVDPLDGGNRPPAIWLTMDPAQPVANDGTWAITFVVDDPDDAAEVTLELVSLETRAALELARLSLLPGATSGEFMLDTRAVAPGAWAVHAHVRGGDAAPCDAWYAGVLRVARTPLADAGTGAADAGTTPAGPGGCACGTADAAFATVLLAWARRRRRPRASSITACVARRSPRNVELTTR